MKLPISENIRIIRESKGYSQDYVASKLKVTQQAYSTAEKNPENMTLKRLKELCNVLEVNLVMMLGEDCVFFSRII